MMGSKCITRQIMWIFKHQTLILSTNWPRLQQSSWFWSAVSVLLSWQRQFSLKRNTGKSEVKFVQRRTWCRCWRCLQGRRTDVSSWRRDPLCCRAGSPDCHHTATPGRRSLQHTHTQTNTKWWCIFIDEAYFKQLAYYSVTFHCILFLQFASITKNKTLQYSRVGLKAPTFTFFSHIFCLGLLGDLSRNCRTNFQRQHLFSVLCNFLSFYCNMEDQSKPVRQ